MPQTNQKAPIRTRYGQIIVSGQRYFCDHPTNPGQKEVLVVERLPSPEATQNKEDLIICRNNPMDLSPGSGLLLFKRPGRRLLVPT